MARKKADICWHLTQRGYNLAIGAAFKEGYEEGQRDAMAGNFIKCGAKPTVERNGWITCNRKVGHPGQHADTKRVPATYWYSQEIGPRLADGSFTWSRQ